MRLGPTEILLIAGILFFLFGARKLPELARGLGAGIRNFKGELKEPPSGRGEESDDRRE